MKLAIVGCGVVAHAYVERLLEVPELEIVGVTDALPGRAEEFAEKHGLQAWASLDEVLGSERVETILNLTPASVHAEITAAALKAGKHVYTEKPMAPTYEEAKGLAELAEAYGVRLACAPATSLGVALQTAWKLVRDGVLGPVPVIYAEANSGRIETWHPAPQAIYDTGPFDDIGVYPLVAVTTMFGPVREVQAHSAFLQRERETASGVAFSLKKPDFTTASLTLANDAVMRLTASFWVPRGRQRGMEFHGARESLYVENWSTSDAAVSLSTDGEEFRPVPFLREPYPGPRRDWSLGLLDLADAIADGRPHRLGAEQGAHIVEVLEAVLTSAQEGRAVKVHSTFPQPAPADWACS